MRDRTLAIILTVVYFLLVVIIFLFKDIAAVVIAIFINVAILSALSDFLGKRIKNKHVCNVFSLLLFFLLVFAAIYMIVPPVIKEFGSFYSVIMENVKSESWKDYIKSEKMQKLIEKIFSYIGPSLEEKIKDLLSTITTSVPNYGFQLFFIILGTIYSLIYMDTLKKLPFVIYPRKLWHISIPFTKDLFANMKRFVQSIFVTALMTGVLFFTLFEIMGLKYSVTIGVWAFITNFMPIVGVIFEYVPVFLFSLSLGLKGVIIMAVATLIIHTISFVTFLTMMKGYTKINPVEMLFLIMIMWKIQGTLGIFVATPIAIFINVFWKHFLSPIFNDATYPRSDAP